MISRFKIDDDQLSFYIQENYGISVKQIEFIPVGDSAYSYKVICMAGNLYFLKLFDHHNDRQKEGIRRLNYYLPLTWDLYHQGLFTNITYPVKNLSGNLYTTLEDITIVLFNYIVGESLADAYPLSNKILKEIAKSMAKLEKITSKINHAMLPMESLDISFETKLKNCISILEGSIKHQNLRGLVLSKKVQIFSIMDLVNKIRNSVCIDSKHQVLCHGDIWGGNLIYQNNQLFLVDWESVIIAPREYNLYSFIGPGFDIFISSYIRQLNQKIKIDVNLIRFYSYRAHLRNLTNWLMNILFRNTDEAQSINDIDMIENHCLDRLDQIEPNISKISRDLLN